MCGAIVGAARGVACPAHFSTSLVFAECQTGSPGLGRCSDRTSNVSSRIPPRLAGRRSHRPPGLQAFDRADLSRSSGASPACARTSRESGRLRAFAGNEAGGLQDFSWQSSFLKAQHQRDAFKVARPVRPHAPAAPALRRSPLFARSNTTIGFRACSRRSK